MTSKPLPDVYAGVLSRNWPKLLEALGRGEKRCIMHLHEFLDGQMFTMRGPVVSVIWQENPVLRRWDKTFGGPLYELSGHVEVPGWKIAPDLFDDCNIHMFFKRDCFGFFPANDDER